MSSHLEQPINESFGHSMRPPEITFGGIKEAHPMCQTLGGGTLSTRMASSSLLRKAKEVAVVAKLQLFQLPWEPCNDCIPATTCYLTIFAAWP